MARHAQARAAITLGAAFFLTCQTLLNPTGGAVAQPTGDGPSSGFGLPIKPYSAAQRYVLGSGESLLTGQRLISRNRRFSLRVQSDGNVVLYDEGDHDRVLWSTNTRRAVVARLTMQRDGNLVLYGPDNKSVWASDTYRKARGGVLQVQDDGNLVIYSRNREAVWASDTRR